MVSDYLARMDHAASGGQDRWMAVIRKAGGGDDRALAGLRAPCRSLRAPGFFPAAAMCRLREGVRVGESAWSGKPGRFLGEFGCDSAVKPGGFLTCRREFFSRGHDHGRGSHHVSDHRQRLCTVWPTLRKNYRSVQHPFDLAPRGDDRALVALEISAVNTGNNRASNQTMRKPTKGRETWSDIQWVATPTRERLAATRKRTLRSVPARGARSVWSECRSRVIESRKFVYRLRRSTGTSTSKGRQKGMVRNRFQMPQNA